MIFARLPFLSVDFSVPSLENSSHDPIGPQDGNHYGFISELYDNPEGRPLWTSEWVARYKSDEDTEYLAISRRYNIDEFSIADSNLLDIYGGD